MKFSQLIVVIIGGFIGLEIYSCSKHNDSANKPIYSKATNIATNNEIANVNQVSELTNEVATSPEMETTKDTYSVNEPIIGDGYQLTVTGFKPMSSYAGLITADEGTTYVYVTYKVKNTSTKAIDFASLPSLRRLIDYDSNDMIDGMPLFDTVNTGEFADKYNDLLEQQIGVGKTIKVTMCYLVRLRNYNKHKLVVQTSDLKFIILKNKTSSKATQSDRIKEESNDKNIDGMPMEEYD